MPRSIREDARHGRVLTVAEAIGYGLVHERAVRRPSVGVGRQGVTGLRNPASAAAVISGRTGTGWPAARQG